eukprot:CAMPEP_0202715504 /NCGR_PEP_ID=MMETSP1385-20130828/90815_1 /ASSEMBLY_ACC=CAM_ASM_000861 /TAXON_ID=933848 /ORGANISM="Elphidium margaritaceum" /LENGTH=307 /DNA_ID=CAMNT_0049376785 /DNA_START=1 /DNA_END=921 /DNA_ORIENTATION=+
MSLLVVVVLLGIWCVKLNSQSCDYELVQADNRNIIFVGRSRAGKSTAINVLKDKDFDPGLFDILRGTRDATVQSFTMKSKAAGNNLHFNIMDTPGLFERAEKDDRRTNEVILDVIKKCIDMEITKLHHVYFVMSALRGLAEEDLKAFDLFSELFLGMEQKISVILSFAQEITEEDYDHYIDQFKNKVPELRRMYEKIDGRIFFLGAAKKSKMANMSMLRENVHKQRAVLFEHIIQQKQTYNVKQLKLYQDNLSLIQKVRETLAECCESTKKCIDLPKFDAFISHYTPEEEEEELDVSDDDDDDDDEE